MLTVDQLMQMGLDPRQMNMGMTPPFNPNAPAPGAPPARAPAPALAQQPMSRAARLANNPAWAMMNQATSNLSNIMRGQPVTQSPAQAYQAHVAAKQKRLAQEEEMRRAQRKLDIDDMVARAQLLRAMRPDKPRSPSAFEQKRDAALSALGYDPANYDPKLLATPEFQKVFESFGSGPLVDMGQQQEDAWEKNTLERNIKAYNQMSDDASRARNREQRLQTMLTYSDLFTGGGEVGQLTNWARTNLEALGFDVAPDASAQQLFDAMATQNQFERTALLKGAISEMELGLAGLMDSTSRNTREGREYILNYRIAEARRAQQIEQAAQAWMERTGQRYDERKFMNSEEYKAIRNQPMVTERLIELGKMNHPDAFENYVKSPEDGKWYLIVPDPAGGEMLQALNL